MEQYRSSENYLEAILMVSREKGSCRSVDVARHLGFSRPSVSNAMARLEASGLVIRSEDGRISLTPEGDRIAGNTLNKHFFFKNALMRLGVEEETAEADACAIEHCISETSYLALLKHASSLRPGQTTRIPAFPASKASE